MRRALLRVGVLGGTLDPVHLGHLAAARAACTALSLDQVWLMPAHVPALKPTPGASPWHRFAMAALAAQDEDHLAVSDLELSRPGPTYTIDTLHALAADGYAASQLFFITGADAFAGIAAWHRFPDVLDAAHLAVVTRPGHAVPADVLNHPAIAPRLAGQVPAERAAGASASESCGIWLIPADTPDVSSSEVRERIITGQDVGTRVPASVALHIRRHGLYTSNKAERRLHGED